MYRCLLVIIVCLVELMSILFMDIHLLSWLSLLGSMYCLTYKLISLFFVCFNIPNMLAQLFYLMCVPLLLLFCLLCDLCLIFFLPFIRAWKWFDDREFDEYLYNDKPKTNRGVLLVHGCGVNESVFVGSRKIIDMLLKEKGIEYRIYSIDLYNWDIPENEGIDIYATRVANKVEKIKRDGVSELVLVGHSMGGLVAAHYVENYCDDKSLVKQVVTIATPWYGVPLLNYIYGLPNIDAKRYADMMPNSEFLVKLRNKVNKSSVKYKTIGSLWDFQVPPGYYSLDNANNVDTIFGHNSIIMVKYTWEYVLADI